MGPGDQRRHVHPVIITRPSVGKIKLGIIIDKAPFIAVKVTRGVTFTFGGLAVNRETAAVISSSSMKEVPGLFCVCEMFGGLFYDNYPGGSGLTSGAVFGRRAGTAAAELAKRQDLKARDEYTDVRARL